MRMTRRGDRENDEIQVRKAPRKHNRGVLLKFVTDPDGSEWVEYRSNYNLGVRRARLADVKRYSRVIRAAKTVAPPGAHESNDEGALSGRPATSKARTKPRLKSKTLSYAPIEQFLVVVGMAESQTSLFAFAAAPPPESKTPRSTKTA